MASSRHGGPHLSFERASSLLKELQNAFSCPKFQRKLRKTIPQDCELADLHGHDHWSCHSALLHIVQEDVFYRYGLVDMGFGVIGLNQTMQSVLDDHPSLSEMVVQICQAAHPFDNFAIMQHTLRLSINVDKHCLAFGCNQNTLHDSLENAATTVMSHPRNTEDSRRETTKNEVRVISFSRSDALSLQLELLDVFSAAPFQKQLGQICREHLNDTKSAAYQACFRQLLRHVQLAIIPRYGFPASEKGVVDMIAAFKLFEDDADVLVNSVAIQEALCACTYRDHAKPHGARVRFGRRPQSAKETVHLLKAQINVFSTPLMQTCMDLLKQSAAARSGRSVNEEPADGYYHLAGRAELAFEVQKQILPRFGFEGSRQGVRDMVEHCSRFVCDPEIANLLDVTNAKLGMTHAACLRFRRLAETLPPKCPSYRSPTTGSNQGAL